MSTVEPDWTAAACRGTNTRVFYPPSGPSPTAVAICQRCPIRAACLDWAMRREEYGIWGGLSAKERQSLKRRAERTRGAGLLATARAAKVAELTRLGWPVTWVADHLYITPRTAQRYVRANAASTNTTNSGVPA